MIFIKYYYRVKKYKKYINLNKNREENEIHKFFLNFLHIMNFQGLSIIDFFILLNVINYFILLSYQNECNLLLNLSMYFSNFKIY